MTAGEIREVIKEAIEACGFMARVSKKAMVPEIVSMRVSLLAHVAHTTPHRVTFKGAIKSSVSKEPLYTGELLALSRETRKLAELVADLNRRELVLDSTESMYRLDME